MQYGYKTLSLFFITMNKIILVMNMQNKYRKLLFITMTLLIIIGIIMIYSASYIWAEYKFSDSFKYVKHQLVFITIGFILIKIIINIDYKFLYKYSLLY